MVTSSQFPLKSTQTLGKLGKITKKHNEFATVSILLFSLLAKKKPLTMYDILRNKQVYSQPVSSWI